jgi:hypothetical protein
VLGVYDESRMIRNNEVFPFHEDVERVHTVWIDGIILELKNKTIQGNYSTQGSPIISLSKSTFETHLDSS